MATKSLGTLTVDLITKVGGFKKGMDEAERSSAKASKKIQAEMREMSNRLDSIFRSVGASALAIGTGVAAGLAAVGHQVLSTIDKMDAMSKSAQKSNMSTEAFSALVYAGSLADVAMDDLTKTMGKLARAQVEAADGVSTYEDAFAKFGVSVKNADGTLKDTQVLFLELADAFQRMQGSPEAMAAGMDIFGRSFQNLIPLLAGGADGIRSAMEEGKVLGQVLTDDAGKAAEAFNDNLTRLTSAATGLTNTLTMDLLPALVAITDQAVEYTKSAEGQNQISETLKSTVDLLAVAFDIAHVAVGVLQAGFSAIAAPIKIFVTLVAGAVDTVLQYASAVASVMMAIGNADFSGAVNAAKLGMRNMAIAAQTASELSVKAAMDAGEGYVKGVEKIKNGVSGAGNPFKNMNDALGKTTEKAKATTTQLAAMTKPLATMNEAMGKAAPAAMGNMKDAMGKVTDATKTQVKAWETASKERQKNLDFFDREAQAMGRKVNQVKELSEVEKAQWEIQQGKYKQLDAAQQKEILRLAQLQDSEKALADTRKGGGGGGGAGGAGGAGKKSEAEKAAEDAAKDMERMEQKRIDAFESAAMKYREMTQLSSESTEAEKAYFETTSGSLAFLNAEQKQYLIGMAERADAAKLIHEAEEEAARLAEREAEEAKRRHEDQIERFEDTMASMEHELELLGKTADEQERINLLKHLGVEATKEQTAAAEAQLAQLQTARTAMEQQVEVMDTIRSSFSGAFQDWVSGSKSFKDAFLGALDSINAKILQMIADNLMAKLFGETGSAGGGSMGGGIAGFIGKLFGGGMAIGGYPQAGKMYEVNERGPEMFSVGGRDYLMMGDESGKITPNHKLGGGGGFAQANNFIVQGRIDRRTQEQIAMQVGQRSQVAMRRNG